jgi:hypothetical protein
MRKIYQREWRSGSGNRGGDRVQKIRGSQDSKANLATIKT